MSAFLQFIPAILCLLIGFTGLICLVLGAHGLRRMKRTKAGPADGTAPPLLSEVEGTARRRSGWALFLKFVCGFGILAVLIGGVGLWLTGVSIGWTTDPSEEWSDGQAPELEPLVRRHCLPFVADGRSVGMTVAVVGGRRTTVMGFGRRSACFGAPASGDTLFEIGSITKTFTGLALAREIESGAVRLDQPAQELLPPDLELAPPAQAVTLRHLTTHTAGFPRLPANVSPMIGLHMFLAGGDPYAGYSEAAFREALRTVELSSEPGKRSDYSNFGAGLLGCALALRSGTNYETFIKRAVCAPLAMEDTTVTLSAGSPSGLRKDTGP